MARAAMVLMMEPSRWRNCGARRLVAWSGGFVLGRLAVGSFASDMIAGVVGWGGCCAVGWVGRVCQLCDVAAEHIGDEGVLVLSCSQQQRSRTGPTGTRRRRRTGLSSSTLWGYGVVCVPCVACCVEKEVGWDGASRWRGNETISFWRAGAPHRSHHPHTHTPGTPTAAPAAPRPPRPPPPATRKFDAARTSTHELIHPSIHPTNRRRRS